MLRQNHQRGAWSAVLSVVFAVWLAGITAGQDPPATQPAAEPQPPQAQPASQPTTQPDLQAKMKKLMELREQRERELREKEQGKPDAPQPPGGEQEPATEPSSKPEQQPPDISKLEELKDRAPSAKQEGGDKPVPPAVRLGDDDDELFGPPYPPATPPSEMKTLNGRGSRQRERPKPTPEGEAKPVPRPGTLVSNATGEGEWFNFDLMPWEDVVVYFAERIGKPLMRMEDLIIGGELTYKSDRKFTKEEAIDELNLLMHMIGYRFVEQEHHIFVVMLSEMPSFIEPEAVFASREEFEQADLRPTDYVRLFMQVTSKPAKKVQLMFETMVPDYMTLMALEDSNQLKMVGLVLDIRKVLTLMDRIKFDDADPRKTRIFEVKTNARDVERLLRELLDVGGGTRPTMRIDPRTRRPVPTTPTGDDTSVRMVADDRTNTIIVKATPDKLDEIQELIGDIDQKPDIGEFITKVIEIRNANATDVADLLTKIFSQEQGQMTPAWQRLQAAQQQAARQRGRITRRTPQQPQQATPEALLAEGAFERAKKTIRIAADERTNSIVVYANQEGHDRVQELLAEIDKPQPGNFRTVKLAHAEAEQIHGTVSQIAQGLGTMAGRGRGASVVLDRENNQFYVFAEREAMQQITDVIADLDVEMPEPQRHVIELKNVRPSDMAQMIQPMLSSGAAASPMAQQIRGRFSRLGRRGRTAAPAAAVSGGENVQIIPLDDAKILIVVCSDEDWAKVEETIKLWDENAITSTPELKTFEIEHGDAQTIAATLGNLYRVYQHPTLGRSQVLVQAEGSAILVYAVRPALEEIEPLVAALDRADGTRYEILPLAHADANDVAQQAQLLFGGLGGTVRGRVPGGGAGGGQVIIQAEPVTNSLIVQADGATLDKIKDYAMTMDQEVGAKAPERKYYSLKNVAPRDVVNAIDSLFGSGGGVRGRFRGQAVGTQIKAVIVGNEVVVDAPAEKQREVEALVQQLDDLSDRGITTLLVKMPGANVQSIAARLSGAFQDRVRQQGVIARFEPDASTETILVTYSKDVQEEAEALLEQYKTFSEGLINETAFYQLKHANANEAAGWLRSELVTLMTRQFGRQAGQQVRVTPQNGTNRIIISAPQVAVTAARPLLEQYDVPPQVLPDTSPMVTDTRKVPGLDVASIANQLNQAFRERKRPDKLRTTFGYDRMTEMLIFTTPRDTLKEIEELIAKFSAETEGMVPEQKFVEIKNADASYVAGQLANILNVRVSGRYGRDVANRISITPDTRLNKIFINAPKVAMEMADALVAELDQKSTAERQLQTIPLENADANTVNGILRTIFNEKIRNRTLQVSVEPLTNSLIVGGTKEDFEEIQTWAQELDQKAAPEISSPQIYDLKNANPWEVNGILQQTFVQKGRGRTLPPSKEIKISIVGGRSIVVQAPPEKMKEIEDLIKKLDDVIGNKMEVRTYTVAGMGSQLDDFARQIQNAVNAQVQSRDQRISVSANPAVDVLIVMATREQFKMIEQAMEQFRDLFKPPQMATITLDSADANQVYQSLRTVLQQEIRAGKVQISVEAMTNSLIVLAAEKEIEAIRTWAMSFDEKAKEAVSPPRIFELKNANPWEVHNVLTTTFIRRGSRAQRGAKQISFEIMGGRNMVVYAPADEMKEIETLIVELDKIDVNLAEVRTYVLPGVGNRLNDLAREVSNGFNAGVEARERRISVTPYAPADALIVTALPDQFEKIEALMDQFKELVTAVKAKTEFFKLEYVDASQIVGTVRDMVQKRTISEGRRGGQDFSVSADPRTNRLIVFAPETILPDVRAVVTELDIEVKEDNVVTIELKFADPWETRNMINDVFGYRGQRARQAATEQVYVTVNNNTLVVKAPPKKLEQIQELIAKIDAEDTGGLQIKTYELKVLNAQMVAGQVQMFLRGVGQVQRRGQMQPGAFAEPTTNTLVVIAPKAQLPFIESLITQIEAMEPDEAISRTYVLKYARADQVQQHVDQMLRVKVAEREGVVRGRATQMRTAVMADPTTNRLFVFAPEEYQELAADLIKMIDEEVDTGEVVHIIQLEKADATQLAQTLQQTMQQAGPRGRSAQPAQQVQITPDAGSNSILLAGLPKDVAEVEGYIEELEAKTDVIPELQIFQLSYSNAHDVADMLEKLFAGGDGRRGRRGRGAGPIDMVTITPDEYTNRLFVTASLRKMRQVEGYIEQFDAPPDLSRDPLTDLAGRKLYFVDIHRGKAFDIAWDVRDMLPDEEQGGPLVEADWFGKYIKVKCRPNEFDRILSLLREFEARQVVEEKIVVVKPPGNLETVMEHLRGRMDDLKINAVIQRLSQDRKRESLVEPLWEEGEIPEKVRQQREREKQRQREREEAAGSQGTSVSRVRPFELGLPVTVALLGDIDAALFDDEPVALQEPPRQPAPAASTQPISAQPLRTPAPAVAPPKAGPSESAGIQPPLAGSAAAATPPQKEQTRILEQPDGSIIIIGPEGDVEDIEDIFDALEDDLRVGEVIRIFEFTYGDVTAAAEVVNIMFNERQVLRLPQQQPQQPQQRGQRGQEGREQGMMEQFRQMVGGRQPDQRGRTEGRRVRIATDPGHNYLIIKCNETDLPEIKQLLRELDIPPGEVELKVFQLRNLDANETAQNIKDVLGISKVQQRRGAAPLRQARTQRGGSPQQQLMEMLQQQMVSVPGVEGGAKVERVEIVPNAITNSLMVSSPPEVMKIIEEVISELEGLEGRGIVGIYHYELKLARVDDVLPLLQEIFAAASGGGAGGRPGRGGGGRGVSPGALGPVNVSGDPRSNAIIFTAEAKDVEAVEAQISALDIAGSIAEAQTYVCQYGDATEIADVVSAVYAAAGAGQRRAPRGQAGPIGGQEVRIVASPSTNAIIVWAPPDKRQLILDEIKGLDEGSHRDFREIELIYADAEKLAEMLLQMFGGGGGQQQGVRRRGGGGSPTGTGGVVIIGDKNAKKLLVRAPDPIFLQIEGVVGTLDQPDERMQIRQYVLKHANAESVVESVRGALTEYLQMTMGGGRGRGGSDLPFDPFSVVADPRLNAITVVGSQQTFTFVESLLATVDVETPAEQRKDFRVFVLDKGNAETVAEMINNFATGQSGSMTVRRRGQQGRRGMPTGGAAGMSRELDVYAVAEPTANTVMVYGKSDDIDIVEEVIIARLEDSIREHTRIETIAVKNVKPTEIVSFIWQFLGQSEGQAPGTRRPGRGAPGEQAGPRIIPNDNNNTLVVRGSAAEIDEVRDLVERFDQEGLITQNVTVVAVPLGHDVGRLASDVERIVNDSEAELAAATGRRARQVSVAPNEFTNALMVSGDPALFGLVTSLVDQLAKARVDNVVTRVVNLGNLSAQDAQQLIDDLQQRSGASGTRGRGGTRQSTPSRRPGRRGDAAWPQLRSIEENPWRSRPVAWLSPYVSVAAVQPAVAAALVTEFFEDDQDDPPLAQTQPAEPPAKGTVQRVVRPRRTAMGDMTPEEPAGRQQEPPQTQPAQPAEPAGQEPPEGLLGVTGELRGDVISQPVGTKQIIITGDERDVAFIEQILLLMEQSAAPAVVEVFTLEYAKATVLAPIIQQAIEAQIQVRKGDDRFSISAEGRSNSLIVSASDEIMEQIAALVGQLDLEKLDEGVEPRVLTLQHVRASDAVAILRPALQELYRIQEVPRDAQAAISAIDRSNSVLVVGTPKDHKDIQRLLDSIDVEITAEDQQASFVYADAVVIQLQNGNADDVAEVLMDMINEQQERAREAQRGGDRSSEPYVTKIRITLADGTVLPELDLERPISIIPEKGTNSLIVFSTRDNNEALTEIVKVFDMLPVGADTEVRAITLNYANAEEVAQLLEDTFENKSPLKRPSEGDSNSFAEGELPPVPPGVTGRGLPYNVVVSHDVRSNTVIVVGRKDAVLLAAGLVAELDRPSVELGLRAHVVALKNYQATAMAEKLDELLEERADVLGADGNKARDSAVIVADDRSNSVVVLATPEVFQMVEDLAVQLDAAENYRNVATRFRRLEYADAQKAAGLLQEVFDLKEKAEEKQSSEVKDTLSVLADTRSNSLVLTGTRDYLTEADAMIDNLDQGFDRTVVMKIVSIRLNSAANIAALLEDMVDKALKEKESNLEGTPIYIAAEPLSDSLLLVASREDMIDLERWVEILDRPSEYGRMVEIIPLRNTRAEDVANAAEDIFTPEGSEVDVTVMHDPTTNSVVAFGPPAIVTAIAGFVRELDGVTATGGAIVRIFKLDQANAEDAGELLTSILEGRSGAVGNGRGGGGSRAGEELEKQVILWLEQERGGLGLEMLTAMRSDIVVIADVRTNTLVITAPPDSMALMESLVARIDVPPDAAKIRVFALRNADAEQMVEMLQELFERQTTGGGRSGGSGDESGRELALGEGTVGGRQEVSFTTDTRTNSVIAAGTPGYLDLVEELVLKLDSKELEDRKTVVYTPRSMVALNLAGSIREYSDADQARLAELGDQISLAWKQEQEIIAIAHEESNQIILDYSPRFEDAVLEVVRGLDQPPPQVSIEVLIVEVSMGNSLELGVEFAFQDLQYAKAGPSDTTTFDFVGGTDVGAAGAGLGGFTFTITGRDFNFLLHTLQSENSLNVLSRPHIVAMDNQPASIEITDSVPYVTGTQTSTTGQLSTSVGRENVGIRLEVTPQINPDGFVRMAIRQEVSDLSDSTIAVGPGLTAPIFNKRIAETVVTVRDNETVVLGGLIQSRDSQSEQKIPIMGDIPLIGPLFRFQDNDERRSELLLILTPRVVRTVEDYRELSIEARDQTGLIPDKVKTNPLMRGLRLRPDELIPLDGEDLLEPFEEPSETPADAGRNEDEYGPLPPASQPARPPSGQSDPNSYDIPIGMLTRRS